jgi:gamma-glutamylcyclotransferase (GGCT)/AIG2-like uncharacterized protein YtfP
MLVAVYGSLLSGLHNHGLLVNSKYVGEDITSPSYTMYDLGSFPGLVQEGNRSYTIELYDVNEEVAKRLDFLEGYDENEEENSFYIRRKINTKFGEASIYYLNRWGHQEKIVEDSSWKNYYLNKNKKRLLSCVE